MSTHVVKKPSKPERHSQGRFSLFVRRIVLATQLYGKHELQNHANAAAYSFLLSVIPVFLLIVLILERAVANYQGIAQEVFSFLTRINPGLDLESLKDIGLTSFGGTAVGVVGGINLLWASRQIFISIHRGMNIIFSPQKKRSSIVSIGLSFIFVTVFVLLIIVMILLNAAFRVFDIIGNGGAGILPFLSWDIFRLGFIYLFVFFIFFLTYRFVPVNRPRTSTSLQGAALCTVGVFIIQFFFSRFFSTERYTFIYGVLGSLILSLVAVQLSFVLYFLFAEYIYVTETFDIIVLERFYTMKNSTDEKFKLSLERYLFRDPEALLVKYTRHYRKGDIVFSQGDDSTDIYFVCSGKVGIYLESNETGNRRFLDTIHEGEIFGEMAYLLDESRTGTAICEEDTVLFMLPPSVFEEFLKVDKNVSYKVIRLLSERLKRTDAELSTP